MKLSQKRLEANRADAARSTGPTTPEGNAHATLQAILAKQILIGNESAGNFQALCDILLHRFAPVDDFEYGLVEELAAAYWRLRRAWALETEILERVMQKQAAHRQLARMGAAFAELAAQPRLDLLHRHESRLHLMDQRALHNLFLISQIAPPIEKYANEPKSPFPCNEFPGETPPKTVQNAPKTAQNRANSHLSPPTPEGQIPTIPATPK